MTSDQYKRYIRLFPQRPVYDIISSLVVWAFAVVMNLGGLFATHNGIVLKSFNFLFVVMGIIALIWWGSLWLSRRVYLKESKDNGSTN